MTMHPAEIAQELKNFYFFRSFSDDLVLQLATMIQTRSYNKGDLILKDGQSNKDLHFIRRGSVEVVVSDVVVTVLQIPGEVFGEMSVVTKNPVTTNLRAATDVDCFILNSDNFEFVNPKDKHRLASLLYRVYSVVLADRLVKTNEKARLFELANRELHQAQVKLETIGRRNVLLVQNDKRQLVLAKMAVGGTGVKLDTTHDLQAASQMIRDNKYDVLIGDDSAIEILKEAHKNELIKDFVLLTSNNTKNDLQNLDDLVFVNSVITINHEKRTEAIKSILTALTKLLTKDLFGLEKYLSWGVEIQSQTFYNSRQRPELRENMTKYFKGLGIRNTFLERINTVSEEMLMNAIYDAPTDPTTGKPLFDHLSRKQEIVLDSHQTGQIRYACDGVYLAVSVSDSFGALSKETIIKYLRSCYEGKAGIYNENNPLKGGAGRGLHQIIENSDLTIFNIKSGFKTEITSLFRIEGPPKDIHPAFNYFYI